MADKMPYNIIYFHFIIEKFNLIYQNYKNKDKQLRIVNQFMMGKGKSSVIMPLLLLNLYCLIKFLLFIIITFLIIS